jgi:4-hydroxy-L-threonine phosphate dehydrogenase PdxA
MEGEMIQRTKDLMIEECNKKCAWKEAEQEKARKTIMQALTSTPPNNFNIEEAQTKFEDETIKLGEAYSERKRVHALKVTE